MSSSRDGKRAVLVKESRRIGRSHVSEAKEMAMRIGIVGAGMIGSTLAKLWADAGHDVRLASRHPDQLARLVKEIGARASAGTPIDAAVWGDVVMLTVPLKAVPGLTPDLAPLVAGKVVLDTGNAYDQRDGTAAREASAHPNGSAGWAAALFPGSKWVKAFNTVYFKTLEREAHRQGDRVGIPLASDHPDALEIAAKLVRDAGFDPVILGALARGKQFEPGTRAYNTGMSGPQLRAMFGEPAPQSIPGGGQAGEKRSV
jgi:8-hydroxy-5-deazaflavin:NADPH oxidoreductase